MARTTQNPEFPPLNAPGLGEIIALDRLIKNLTALKAERMGRIKPTFAIHFAERAKDILVIDDLQKTVPLQDGNSVAQLQLRAKNTTRVVLDAKGVALFTKVKIPLRLQPATPILNVKYTEPDPNQTPVIARLAKLVSAHPEAGVPIDIFARTEPTSYPTDDALLRTLRLPTVLLQEVLPYLADTVVINGEVAPALMKQVYRDAAPGTRVAQSK